MTRQPFSLPSWGGPAVRRLVAPLTRVVERLLGLTTLNRLYRALPDDGRPFCVRALDVLGVTLDVDERDVQAIPRSGPVVFVANHPHGGLDGLAVVSLLQRTRPNVKVLGNYLLERIPAFRDLLLPVDPFDNRSPVKSHVRTLRTAVRWLEAGGALVVFPAGEVSHTRGRDGRLIDSEWTSTAARLVHMTQATAVPIFIAGGNSEVFRLVGAISPRLRTILLPRELLRQRGRRIALRVGDPVSIDRVAQLGDAEKVTSYLRMRSYGLGAAPKSCLLSVRSGKEPIAAAEDSNVLAGELAALSPSHLLLRSGSYTVCLGRASEVPHTLLEIGRLREIAFRAVGEGSGRARDLDEFDCRYHHLFVWNHERREIVGAYRVGPTDEILPRVGPGGLYTNTLFRYDDRLLSQIGPALELGRAFVRTEYQRDYGPLMLLWKGIGAFVAANPRYRMLFGPVSISNDYQSVSRQILARFLYATSYRPELAQLVKARHPPAFLRQRPDGRPLFGNVAKTIAEVGALVAEIERDGKGVPVLLRQYLKLNARLLGFNIDPAFGNALDGLMLVDLTEVDRTILFRYLGAAGGSAFLAYHGLASERRVG